MALQSVVPDKQCWWVAQMAQKDRLLFRNLKFSLTKFFIKNSNSNFCWRFFLSFSLLVVGVTFLEDGFFRRMPRGKNLAPLLTFSPIECSKKHLNMKFLCEKIKKKFPIKFGSHRTNFRLKNVLKLYQRLNLFCCPIF